MKFTDGNWMMRKGVRAAYAAEAYEVRAGAEEVTVLAPTSNIRHRGDTLGGPVLTVRLSAPMDGVIRVRISHFEGGVDRGPHFKLFPDAEGRTPSPPTPSPSSAHTSEEGEGAHAVILTSGPLSVRVPKTGWAIEFVADGKVITRSPGRSTALMTVDEDKKYIQDQLLLGVGENVYGLGERFTAFVKNGQTVDIWNQDGGTNSEQAYKNIPFYLTSGGYGVFVNDPGPVSFEVGTERTSRVSFSVPGDVLEYFVIYGPTPKEVLRKYTALTGRPALPPAWSFGLWLSTSFTTNYDEATVTSFIQGMEDRDLPLHVFHYDCFWMKAFHWTDLEWDPAMFPDPAGMLRRLKARGLKICTWINPYIAQASKLFEEGKKGGFLMKRPNGDVWQWDMWQPGMGIVDFTNPAATKWFQGKLAEVIDIGVDALKTDFGERIPTDVAYHDGSDPVRMHNYYTQLYNQAVFDLLKEKTGEGVLFARSATVGGQCFPVHWGGDCWSDFEAMAESLRGGLSLCLSGFGFWSHDIGGFEGLPPEALYKRWVAFGLLSSHSRLHGSGSFRVPWQYSDEACDTLRFFTKLKCRLMPYLFGAAVEAHEQGMPVMRAMLLEFPADPAAHTLDRQYMLGESLLVAPVFSDHEVEYYVPAGRWTSFLSGEEIVGPKWVRETHGFLSVPLLVRPNSIISVGAVDQRPDYDFADGVTFEVFALDDGVTATAVVPTMSGGIAGTVSVTRTGERYEAKVDGDVKNWSVVLVGLGEAGTRGLALRPEGGASSASN
ncbi:alpha-xylosidase [Fimbriimonas ginsengisoli]|uniref:alpha-D-xyloside xylohydrolase n=1 Tax=Fimbriimonas ginsengisoli Gsoil 348 TaxID=661478 RepID=A0A068NW04_FIMGI|nr:alpha-xylosidase [Fimbriimonas ginsengisoli]AIE85789.1 alpha-xylosidase YicI [Fimbriimonas ginsengisoli Gsoil 348]